MAGKMPELRDLIDDDMLVDDLAAALRVLKGPLLIPFRLASECGLLEEEIVHLTWADVRPDSQCMMTTRGSAYKRYTVGLSAGLAAALRSMWTEAQEQNRLADAVCRDSTGKPYTEKTLRSELADLCGLLELDGVGWGTIHDCWLRMQGLAK